MSEPKDGPDNQDRASPGAWTEVRAEVERQHRRWGDSKDDSNSPWLWVVLICYYATRWQMCIFSGDAFRDCMVRVAALAISAIESLDRQRRKSPTHRASFE